MFSSQPANRRSQAKKRQSLQWSIAALENRIMLAGDCAIAIAASDAAALVARPTEIQSSNHLVFVDAGIDDVGHFLSEVSDQHEIILLDSNTSGLDQISDVLANRSSVSSVHILAHGKSGQLQLGNQPVDQQALEHNSGQVRGWAQSLTKDADILIYGCDTGEGSRGQQFIARLAELTGADVAASNDKTGSTAIGANWILEQHVGMIESSLAFDARTLESYQATLPITIRAAGDRGEEQMQLQIDGVTVQTWNNVGGDASSGNYLTFTHDADGISADQVRVVFTNDLFDPANGIDRNLRVDNISLDGITYETEASDVFSTGTWKSADGITPGFRESETLHTNGYFQYADSVGPPVDGAFAIINEIHYNPGPDGEIDGDAEFLELYNPGNQDFDLSGASFSGFDLTFDPGTILAAGQYAIVAPSISIAESEWGVTPIAEFAGGGLSGGGETIQLIAADGETIIDEVSYDDTNPWPGGPDGNGPSLELINPTFDNSSADNWGTSNPGPTPAALNSIFSESPVEDISNITVTPGQPLPNQAFTVSATIPNATFADLTFKIMFDEDQTVAMTNVGGDVWQATVPGQDAGTLVRYRIDSDVATAPFEGDTINYLGVVVSPADIVDNELPVFHWFVEPEAFEELTTELFLTNTKIPTVVAYGDQVIDNAEVRIRGSFSRNFDKKGFKIELPDGYLLDLGPYAATPVDEFGIVSDFADWSFMSAQISWEIFNAETDSFTSSFHTRVEQNGEFYGIYRFQELYDGTWRKANGHDDGEFHQADGGGFSNSNGFDKKEPGDEDYTAVLAARDVLISAPSDAKTEWLYDNVDIPAAVNHMALTGLVRHYDQHTHNFYAALDGDTNRWSLVEWDLDLTWRDSYSFGGGELVTTPEAIGNEFMDAIWEVPEFQEMYWQRLQTLIDTYLTTDYLIDRRAELVAEMGQTNSDLEFDAWGRDNIFRSSFFVNGWQDAIDLRRSIFANESRLPGNSLTNPNIVINELHYNPADDDAEFLELYNASNQAVDLSGWSIDGVGLTIASGTVILPGDYVVFTDADTQFRDQAPGDIYVGGQYSGGLSGGGETVTLLDVDGNVIDQVSYDDAAPWPTEPDGDGFTLALIDSNANNDVASNWAASNQLGGTPGTANGITSVETTTIKVFAAGNSTNEIIELEIAGVVVATFDIGENGGALGDYQARNFIELSYESEAAVAASDVRINFINDFYDAANAIDFNVRIDRIEIDSTVYETEASSVFSTGTWLSGVGITPGFRLSETLHSNGYFQFDAIG